MREYLLVYDSKRCVTRLGNEGDDFGRARVFHSFDRIKSHVLPGLEIQVSTLFPA